MIKETKKLLTISLLVSNRIDTIRKCMESVKPLLEQLPSELIVVDTVGEENSDGSLAIAKEYATKVVHFDWCNDFAAARNAGLKEAQGAWFLFLDDDEWFEDVTPIINFFTSGEYEMYDCAGYYVRNYSNLEGTEYADAYVGRMVRLTKEHRFVGRIHEQVEPAGRVSKRLECYVHHYGYVFQSKEAENKHFERNVSLLKEELAKNPENLHAIAQLVQEYKVAGWFQEEKMLCEKTVSSYQGNWESQLVQYLILNLATVGRRSGNGGEDELTLVEQQYPMTGITKLACTIEHIIYAQLNKDWKQVLLYVKEFLRIRGEVQRNAEGYVIAEFMDAISEDKQQEVILAGLRAMMACGQYEDAEILFPLVNWKNDKVTPYEQLQILFSVYETTRNGSLMFRSLNGALENRKLHMAAQTLLNSYLAGYPERRPEVTRHMSGNFD